MKLVKDLSHSGIIYYWIDDSGEKISPDIACLTLAEEWRTKYLFSTYEGEGRRRSIIDRRRDEENREHLDTTLLDVGPNSDGRRIADISVKVDIDLFAEKIKKVLLENT
ncbi:MAG: hypothetical protein V7731_03655 [Amphritea sp.]